MTRLTTHEDEERTFNFFGFVARSRGLERCDAQLVGQPTPEMQTFKQRVLQQGDQLPPDQFSAWLASTALVEWMSGVCRQCPSTGRTESTCRLWDEVVASHFARLVEIRRRLVEKPHVGL